APAPAQPQPADSATQPDVSTDARAPTPSPRTGRDEPRPYWNSYAAGVVLGLVLLAAFVITGRGLGASGAVTRLAAHTLQKTEAVVKGGTAAERDTLARHNPYTAQYINDEGDSLDDFLLYMFVGIIVGGFISGVLAHRAALSTSMGPHTNIRRRLLLAAVGGFVSAFGARLARGCTSGQALTGGATLALGSWAFMLAVFAGGYALAWFVRKEWL
ncbi:MAG: YeeE/YedE thiosulfate transporter family protein, partial [Myxococcota bacterium]